jgi:type IV pilus assembly protein PilM
MAKPMSLGMSSNWPQVLGLDVAAKSIKYVLLSRSGNKFIVKQFGKKSFAEEYMVANAISELLQREKQLKKVKIVLGLDSSKIAVKQDSIPVLTPKEIHQMIQFEFQKELGGEEEGAAVVFDYMAIGPDPQNSVNQLYISVGVMDAEVNEHIAPFVTENVIPAKVFPSIMAVGNYVPYLPREYDSKFIGFLDIGATRSMLLFFKNDRLQFFREIMVGGEDFTKSITGTIFHEGKAIQFSIKEANIFKKKYGYPLGFTEGMSFEGAPISEIGAMMRPTVERLIGEIQRSIGFYMDKSGTEKLSALFLLGGGARLQHLSTLIEEKINVAVHVVPFPKSIQVEGNKTKKKLFKQKFLEMATACGLAMETRAGINLLPDQYKKSLKISNIRKIFNTAAVLLILILALIFNSQLIRERILNSEIKELTSTIANAEKPGQIFEGLKIEEAELQKKITAVKSLAHQDEGVFHVVKLITHITPEPLTLKTLEVALEEIVPENKKQSRVQKTQSAKEKAAQPGEKPKFRRILKLEGFQQKPQSDVRVFVAQFIVDLKKSGYFSEVDLVNEETDEETNTYKFFIVSSFIQEPI